jgi:hypothetical protein
MDSIEPWSHGDKNAASNEEHGGQFLDAKNSEASAGAALKVPQMSLRCHRVGL